MVIDVEVDEMNARKVNVRAIAIMGITAVCCVLSRATAYDVGGHHYTISAILAGLPAPGSGAAAPANPTAVDPYKRLEAFCVELPDLVPELDAVTQRAHVLLNRRDWKWGVLGQCGTATSRHMVATQWYIHGLTGLSADTVRTVAQAIIQDRQAAAMAASGNPQERVNLTCEAGFGIHLLGDTFAHSQLSKPDTLYKTGNGHWKDMHVPDDMLSRDLTSVPPGSPHWTDWIKAAAAALGQADNSAQLIALSQPVLQDKKLQANDYGETALSSALRKSLSDDWEPYKPALEAWRRSNAAGVIDPNVTCDGLILPGILGEGIQAVEGARPNCDAVWTGYLRVAIEAFAAAGVDPIHDGGLEGCDPTDDRLSNGVT